MIELAQSHILSLMPYLPAEPLDSMLKITRWAKLGSNENCLGPSKEALFAANESLKVAHFYPNEHRFEVVHAICRFYKDYGLNPKQVALGNGTSELIVNLVRGLVSANEAIVTAWPTFIMYRLAAKAHGVKEIAVSLDENLKYRIDSLLEEIHRPRDLKVKLVFLANPNNPTGSYLNKEELEYFVKELPKSVVLALDEAYIEYVVKKDFLNGLVLALSRPRTVVLRTFSKVYGLAGLRLGMAIGCEQVIDVLARIRDPFNVNSAVQYAAIAALNDQGHVAKSVAHNEKMKLILSAGLKKMGFSVFDSVANFVLAKRAPHMKNMEELSASLLKKGVIVRPLSTYDLADYLRITVGTNEEIDLLFTELANLIGSQTMA